MQLYIESKFKKLLSPNSDSFSQIMSLEGKVYRQLENRRTIRYETPNKNYFVKQHFGVGWKEIFKNLFQFRLPVLGAKNEWRAIQRLNQLNTPTLKLVAYGERGHNPARRQSFLVTEALEDNISLEDVGKIWAKEKPAFQFKQAIIKAIADIARTIHKHGINHRDFYICHFLMKQENWRHWSGEAIVLYLIDLHRMGIRHRLPKRWQIKDISGLYFSSMDLGLTQRDILRFLRCYFNQPLRTILKERRAFLKAVEKRAIDLYNKIFSVRPKLPTYYNK